MADILISMNKTTDKLWKYADEWEKTPEHFDGVNPFCVAIHAVRQMTNVPELLKEQPEQKHGHRMLFRHPNLGLVYRCSVCKLCVYDKYKFCPHCGAKMDGEVKQE